MKLPQTKDSMDYLPLERKSDLAENLSVQLAFAGKRPPSTQKRGKLWGMGSWEEMKENENDLRGFGGEMGRRRFSLGFWRRIEK